MAIEIDNDNGEIRIDGYEYAASKLSIKTYSISSEVSQTGNAADLRLTDNDGYVDNVTFAAGSNVSIVRTNSNTITISSSDIDSNTTYSISAESSLIPKAGRLRLTGSDGYTDDVVFLGGTNLEVVRTDANTLTINSLQNSFYTVTDGYGSAIADQPNDVLNIVPGPGIGIVVDGPTDTVTISNLGVRDFNGQSGDISYYSFSNVTADGYTAVADQGADTLTIVSGPGINATVNPAADSLTIANTGVRSFNGAAGVVTYNAFGTISDGYVTATADQANDTILFIPGSGIGVLVGGPGDSLTISNTGVTQFNSQTGNISYNSFGSITDGYVTAVADQPNDIFSILPGAGISVIVDSNTDTATISNIGVTQITAGSGISVSAGTGNVTVSSSETSIVRGTNATIGFGATTAILSTATIPINTTVEIEGVILLAFSNAAAANTYTVSLTTGSGTIGANTLRVGLGFAAHAGPTAGSPGETTKQAPSFTYPQQIANTNDHTLRFSGIFQTDGTTPNSLVINIRNNCLNPGENLVVYTKSFMKYNVI
jgi:hypothetical protein